jgi:hypothetical protein
VLILVRRRGDHGGGKRPEGGGARVHRRLRADDGESVGQLIKDPPAAAPVPPILPPQEGFLSLRPVSASILGALKGPRGRTLA